MDIKTMLKILTAEAGVSGEEKKASEKTASLLREYAEDVSVDELGNVTGFVRAKDNAAKTLMLDAHIDRVGLVVTYIGEDGFIGVGKCGFPDIKTLFAQSVTIHGREDVKGVVSTLPPHVSKDNEVPEITKISVDAGFSSRDEAQRLVSQGDKITIDSDFRELCGKRVSTAAIDDRGGVCVILAALELLKGKNIAYNLAISFSVGEEVGKRGAKMTAFKLRPDEAIEIDVSFGETPDSSPKDTAPLGSGAMIGFSAVLDRKMSERLVNIAKEKNIPFTREIMPENTGTNADEIAESGSGVRCCTVSFPIRYMHTPVETVDISDMEAAARLVAEYALGGA